MPTRSMKARPVSYTHLAAGKGVLILDTLEEAKKELDDMLAIVLFKGIFKDVQTKVLV